MPPKSCIGDGYRLLLEHEAAHKDLFDTLRRWPQRMLLTPVPVASWTYREARLYQLWAVFQADLGGLMQAARFVENGMDDENLPPTFAEWQRQCRRSEIDADTDRDWDTPAEHRDYLREAGDRDNALYRWLRALSEIENCLVKHPAVANAVVVPKPDADRGAVVKAYVVLAPGQVGDDALVRSLQQHVRGQLAPYEYPKEIEFIDALPMTTTGKVQRRVLRLQEEERARAAAGAA